MVRKINVAREKKLNLDTLTIAKWLHSDFPAFKSSAFLAAFRGLINGVSKPDLINGVSKPLLSGLAE